MWAVVLLGVLGSDAKTMREVIKEVMDEMGLESEGHGLGRDVKVAPKARASR